MDEAEEQRSEVLEAWEDAPEAFQSSEQMCYLVAPLVCLPVLHPRGVPGLERPNPECEAEVERQLACRVPCVGARSITSAGPAPWRPRPRSSLRPSGASWRCRGESEKVTAGRASAPTL